jgi:hypothetical protein
MLKLGSEDVLLDVVAGTLSVGETGTLSVTDTLLLDGKIGVALDVGTITLSVEDTLPLPTDDASLVFDGRTSVNDDVKLYHDVADTRLFDDSTGGNTYPLVVAFTGRLEIAVGWTSEDELVIGGRIGVGVKDVALVVEVTAGLEGMGRDSVPVPHVERDVLELLP